MRVIYLPIASMLLFAGVLFFPKVGGLFIPFSPLLLLLYLNEPAREKRSDIFFGLSIAACIAIEPYISIYYVVTVVFTALLINRMRKQPDSNWLPVAVAPLPAFILGFSMLYFFTGVRNSVVEYVTTMLEALIVTAKSSSEGNAAAYADIVSKNLDLAAISVVLVFPGLIYLALVLIAYFTKTVFTKIKKEEHEVFRIPDNLVWAMLGGFAFFFMSDVFMRSIAINTLFIFSGLYFLQGFEILRYWLNRFKITGIFKALIYILMFSEPPLMLILVFFGLFSIWFNFVGKSESKSVES